MEAAFKNPQGDAGDDGDADADAGSRPPSSMASVLEGSELMDMSYSAEYRQRRGMDTSVCST